MEFDFDINNLFGDVITKVDRKLVPFKRAPDTCTEHRNQLKKVLDQMGEASSRAQGLHGPITSGRKLEVSDHHVYVIKDGEAHGDTGGVIGFIKVGHKKLFVYDHNGGQHEMDPVCVLDFYVHESRQRQGHGKRLFQHMLQAEAVKAQHLAVDRPSHKFSAFLQKHYGLRAIIPQVNNFVVFEGFFGDRTDVPVRGARQGSAGRPPIFPYRRPSHVTEGTTYDPVKGGVRLPHRPSSRPPSGRRVASGAANRIDQEKAVLKDVNIRPSSRQAAVDGIVGSGAGSTCLVKPETLTLNLNSIAQPQSNSMSAGAIKYSRHYGRSSATPPPRKNSAGRRGQNGVNKQLDLALPNGNVGDTERVTTPPLLKREGPSVSHVRHQDYLSRDGHLKLAPRSTTTTSHLPDIAALNQPAPVAGISPTYTDQSLRNITANTTWTVFGVIPSGYQNRPYAQRKYQHTKLW